jgi:hypothetical protein
VLLVVAVAACGNSSTKAPSPTPAPDRDPDRDPDLAPAPTPTPSTRTLVFSYTGSDGEFSYLLEVYSDGTWRRSEHSGSATPAGTLAPDVVAAFRERVAAAPFTSEPAPCKLTPIGRATYTDGTGRYAAASTAKEPGRGWVPCGSSVDAATTALISCLERLTGGATGC